MFYEPVDPRHKTSERNKARDLRRSAWWRRKLSDGICHYCGERFPANALTMDHKIPVARGGRSTKSNVVTSCKPCNNDKKAQTPVEMILERRGPEFP
jgi:5-methylcytosine-specific restriction endonuclease McrA